MSSSTVHPGGNRVYDVFLSHSSTDKPAVEQLARRLQQHGLRPFLDKWHLTPGDSWVPALERALAESETAAVLFGPSAPAPWRNEEMQLALTRVVHTRADFRLIPILLPGSSEAELTGFLRLRVFVDFRGGLDNDAEFERLVAAIQGRAPMGTLRSLPDDPAPYRGLLAFEEVHGEYFFGRQPDIERVLRMLEREQFVAVVGPSGCGKSSLILGGVLPRLMQPGDGLSPGLRAWVMRPGDRPLRALADALATCEGAGVQRLFLSDALHTRFLNRPDGLRTAIATLALNRAGPCLLVIDQFEELFTHASKSGGTSEITAFIANLHDAALEGTGALRILVTLRADFFNRCLEFALIRKMLQDRAVLLGSLDEQALHDVILRPAQKVGATLERGLLDTILKEFSREPGALPLLEDTLDQLWRARKGEWLTLEAYKDSGGISRALQSRAQACYEALEPKEQEVARLILIRLTSLGEDREDSRRRVLRAELHFPGIPDARVEHVLRALSGPRARLIVVDQGCVEVAHEILILTWPALRKWLDEDRRDLRVERRLLESAGEWGQRGRDVSYLDTGARLLEAEELFKRKPTLFNQLESEFITASALLRDQQQRERDEQAKRELNAARQLAEETEARRKSESESRLKAQHATRQLRKLIIGLLAAFATLLLGSFLLYAQYHRAEENSQRAEREKRVAFSRELVLSARQNVREDPQRALLLLQEAQRLGPVDNLGESLDAWSREPCVMVIRGDGSYLFHASYSPNGTRIITTSDRNKAHLWDASSGELLTEFKGTAVAFNQDGTRVFTATRDGVAHLWDTSSGGELLTLRGHSSVVWSVAVSPDGKRLLTASYDGTARLWNSSSGELLDILSGHSQKVVEAEFSPDGSRILTASDDGTARLWDGFTGKPVFTLQGHTGEVNSAVFSRDGARILTASDDGTARLWDAYTGKALLSLRGHTGGVNSAAFSPDGVRVITASSDETARIWDALTGKNIFSLHGNQGSLGIVAFSPDGSRALTTSYGNVLLWHTASGKLILNLEGHTQDVRSAVFSPDGKRIVTASFDGTARVWDISPGKPLAMIRYGTKGPAKAEFNLNGERLLTSGTEVAHLVETSSGMSLAILEGQSKIREAEAFSPDGSRFLTTASNGSIQAWDGLSGKHLFSFDSHAKELGAIRFSSDGARILTSSREGAVHVWDSFSGREISTAEPRNQGPSAGVVISPDGSLLFIASKNLVRSWDISSGKPVAEFNLPSGALVDMALSPEGQRLRTTVMEPDPAFSSQVNDQAAGDSPFDTLKFGTVHKSLWDASSGEKLVTIEDNFPSNHQMSFSPDGSRLLNIKQNGDIGLWDSSSGRSLQTIPTSFGLFAAQLSPDNSRILSFFFQGGGVLWDASTGKALTTFEGHSDRVNAMTFNRDGTLALTASADKTARLWDAASGKPLSTFSGHLAAVREVAFNRDGSRLITISDDGAVRLWPSWRWNPEAFAALNVGRDLTCEERVKFLHEDIDC